MRKLARSSALSVRWAGYRWIYRVDIESQGRDASCPDQVISQHQKSPAENARACIHRKVKPFAQQFRRINPLMARTVMPSAACQSKGAAPGVKKCRRSRILRVMNQAFGQHRLKIYR